jgi:hypothetical protein
MENALIEFDVDVNTEKLRCLLVEPSGEKLAPHPALLLTFGISAIEMFSSSPQDIPTRIFAGAGHRILSFDLQYHGARAEPGIEGLDAMCDSFLAGNDPFVRFANEVKQVINACESRGLISNAGVVACGVSRAGYCAIEAAASDSRLYAVAAIAPVTNWRRLLEFEPAKDDPRRASLALSKHIDALASCSIYLAVGDDDQRVGTDECLTLAEEIAQSRTRRGARGYALEIHVVSDSPGHSLSDRWRADAAHFLVDCVNKRVQGNLRGLR